MASQEVSKPNFGDAIRPFRDAGIPARALLPIVPPSGKIDRTWKALRPSSIGKAPARFIVKTGTWRGLFGNYVRSGVSSAEQAEFSAFPTANVGLVARPFPGIDSDAESDAARRLVERAIVTVFGSEGYAERIRGQGPRRLYVFMAAAPDDEERMVRTRHLKFRLPDEPEHLVHGLDILGTGTQYLIAGTHPSGDQYEWQEDASLTDPYLVASLTRIENADIERFIEALEEEIDASSGKIISSRGSATPGELRDYSNAPAAMPVHDILSGLERLPNTEDNFPERDDLVAALGAVKAAMGQETANHVGEIEAWATKDEDWCPPEYFDQIWRSLDRGVRVGSDALDQLFRKHGVGIGARSAFPDDARAVMEEIEHHKAGVRDADAATLADVADRYVFGEVNMRGDDAATPRVRPLANVKVEWKALDWFYGKSEDLTALPLLAEIHNHDRWSRRKDDQGFWNFLRDLKTAHPDRFYSGETEHPNHDRGYMVQESDEDGRVQYFLNMRPLPKVQRIARKRTNSQQRDYEDVKAILEFMNRVFGKHAGYELDTLAYMAQTGHRPGHLLFLVGDQGTGKSAYALMLKTMFDGSPKGSINGARLANESALRFAFADMGAQRILEIRELPEGSRSGTRAIVTSIIKQIVDVSGSGDFVSIEKKGKDAQDIRNFSRVVITSNYQNAIQVEERDRRIFYVHCGINYENKPGDEYYVTLFDIIGSPERLAAFWRFLCKRDVSGYSPADYPPVSNEKLEQQIASIDNPWVRHLRAAVMALVAADRQFFDMAELSGIMTAMSLNEWRNSNKAIDDRQKYDFKASGAQGQAAIRQLEIYAEKVASYKSNGVRVPTIYGMKTASKDILYLAGAKKSEVLHILKADRDRHPLSDYHPLSLFVGPPLAALTSYRNIGTLDD